MATYVGVRSLNRNRLRVGDVQVYPNATTQVDLDNAKVRRDLQRHSAIGAVAVVAANNAWNNAAGSPGPSAGNGGAGAFTLGSNTNVVS